MQLRAGMAKRKKMIGCSQDRCKWRLGYDMSLAGLDREQESIWTEFRDIRRKCQGVLWMRLACRKTDYTASYDDDALRIILSHLACSICKDTLFAWETAHGQ